MLLSFSVWNLQHTSLLSVLKVMWLLPMVTHWLITGRVNNIQQTLNDFSMKCLCLLISVPRVRSTAIAVWFPRTSWKKCLMTWRCIWPTPRPTSPRKSLPTGPPPTLRPASRRANGYTIIAALSARPCVHPSSVLSLDFRLSLPPLAVCVLFIVCVRPCGDSGDYTN